MTNYRDLIDEFESLGTEVRDRIRPVLVSGFTNMAKDSHKSLLAYTMTETFNNNFTACAASPDMDSEVVMEAQKAHADLCWIWTGLKERKIRAILNGSCEKWPPRMWNLTMAGMVLNFVIWLMEGQFSRDEIAAEMRLQWPSLYETE